MRLKELGLPELMPYSRVWERSIDDPAKETAHVIHEDHSKKSILFPFLIHPLNMTLPNYLRLFKKVLRPTLRS